MKTVTIIIPVFNEEKTVGTILEKTLEMIKNENKKRKGRGKGEVLENAEYETVVINDGSTDSTKKILKTYTDNPQIRIIYHAKNLGKGAAIRTGFEASKGDVIVIQDADLEYDPSQIPKIIKPILKGKADVVYGSRFLGKKVYGMFRSHTVGNKLLSFISSLILKRKITDVMTCYKAFKKDLIEEIESNRFEVETELTAKLLKKGVNFLEIPIEFHPRRIGKKIKKIDGVKSLIQLLKQTRKERKN
ncbi:MAG: glycosyltransferase family 2 protein [Candidatus Hodarchaeota archaeon]